MFLSKSKISGLPILIGLLIVLLIGAGYLGRTLLSEDNVRAEDTTLQIADDGINFDFNIHTESITDHTMVPLTQFTDEVGVNISQFGDDYYLLSYEDEHLILTLGEEKVRQKRETFAVNPAPIKVNDDILVPLGLLEILLVDREIIPGEEDVKDDRTEQEIFIEEGIEKLAAKTHFFVIPAAGEVEQGDSIELEIKLVNNTDSTKRFTFNTGQKFDLKLLKNEEAIYQWSRGRMFTQAIEEVDVGPQEKKSWSATIDTAELEPGTYRLTGWLTDRENSHSADEQEIIVQ